MRIVKEYDERRREILEKSSILFATKGYEKTTITNILKEVNIAKGTFYYYFKSKEDVLDALVDQMIDSIVEVAQEVANSKELSIKEKLFHIIFGIKEYEQENDKTKMKEKQMKESLHRVENAKLHIKSITGSIMKLTPVITQVIEEGIEEGIFSTDYPKETIEVLLVSSAFLFDEGIFRWESDEVFKKIKAFIHIMEVTLGVDPGNLMYLLPAIQYGNESFGEEKNDEKGEE